MKAKQKQAAKRDSECTKLSEPRANKSELNLKQLSRKGVRIKASKASLRTRVHESKERLGASSKARVYRI